MKAGLPVRKGHIDPIPYVEKAQVARTSVGPKLFDVARMAGGVKTPTKAPPLPLHLQPDRRKLVRTNTKRAMRALERFINPEPTFTLVGPFKVYAKPAR